MAERKLWVFADIHGMFDPFYALLQHIRALDNRSGVQSEFVFLGDYIDYGPAVNPVIDLLLQQRQKHETVFLAGNHEDLMLHFLSNSDMFKEFGNVWFQGNGGQATVSSMNPHSELFCEIYGQDNPIGKMRPEDFELNPRYLEFFLSLKYGHTTKVGDVKFGFSHSFPYRSPDPTSEITFTDQFKINEFEEFNEYVRKHEIWVENTQIWNRSESRDKCGDFLVVHGHSPTHCLESIDVELGDFDVDSGLPFVNTMVEDLRVHRSGNLLEFGAEIEDIISINIDTGAVYGIALTALGISEKSLAGGYFDVLQYHVSGPHRTRGDIELLKFCFSRQFA